MHFTLPLSLSQLLVVFVSILIHLPLSPSAALPPPETLPTPVSPPAQTSPHGSPCHRLYWFTCLSQILSSSRHGGCGCSEGSKHGVVACQFDEELAVLTIVGSHASWCQFGSLQLGFTTDLLEQQVSGLLVPQLVQPFNQFIPWLWFLGSG